MKPTNKLITALSGIMIALVFSACNGTTSQNISVNVDKTVNTATVNSSPTTTNSAPTVSNSTPNSAQSKTEVTTPAKDSPERTAIMDALRIPVGKELKQEVIFTVDKLNIQGDWAFFSGKPKNKDGGEPNWKITKYQESIDNDDFEEGLYALLKQTNGKWEVITYMMNCTDVCYLEWDKEFKAPKAILK